MDKETEVDSATQNQGHKQRHRDRETERDTYSLFEKSREVSGGQTLRDSLLHSFSALKFISFGENGGMSGVCFCATHRGGRYGELTLLILKPAYKHTHIYIHKHIYILTHTHTHIYTYCTHT